MKPILKSTDFSWDFVTIAHWTSAEVNTAVVCACLLAIRPLVSLLWSKLRRVLRIPTGQTTLGSGPPTIGSESVRGSRLPSDLDRLERGYGRDKVLFSTTEVEDPTPPLGNVGREQSAVGMEELAAVKQGRRPEV
jgi:hypothetical protein